MRKTTSRLNIQLIRITIAQLIKCLKMEVEELFYDEDMERIEEMRSERKKMKDKDFAKLINKKELSDFEMDEIFS